MKEKKKIVFDASAIMRWVQEEKGFKRVKEYIQQAQQGQLSCFINQFNLAEVYCVLIKRLGLRAADTFLRNFEVIGVEIILPVDNILWEASRIKSKHQIPFADALVVSSALTKKATILTSDLDFKRVAKTVHVEWL